jgi:hypothetical protein
VLFFLISLLFPLYLAVFPPNQAYAVFGLFLVFTFFLYLLGVVFVFGAELNAFLQEPARSAALAEATQQARHGKAEYDQQAGQVRAQAQGDAPALSGTEGSPSSQMARNDQGGAENQETDRRGILGRASRERQGKRDDVETDSGKQQGKPSGGFAGRLLGLVGLVAAAALLRGRTMPQQEVPSGAPRSTGVVAR